MKGKTLVSITNKEGALVSFIVNDSQIRLLEALCEEEILIYRVHYVDPQDLSGIEQEEEK